MKCFVLLLGTTPLLIIIISALFNAGKNELGGFILLLLIIAYVLALIEIYVRRMPEWSQKTEIRSKEKK